VEAEGVVVAVAAEQAGVEGVTAGAGAVHRRVAARRVGAGAGGAGGGGRNGISG